MFGHQITYQKILLDWSPEQFGEIVVSGFNDQLSWQAVNHGTRTGSLILHPYNLRMISSFFCVTSGVLLSRWLWAFHICEMFLQVLKIYMLLMALPDQAARFASLKDFDGEGMDWLTPAI